MMADFNRGIKLIFELEFNNDPYKFLHQNKTEKYLTIGGVYAKANPSSINWGYVESLLTMTGGDMKRTSKMLYHDDEIMRQVMKVFKKGYWDIAKLDKVENQSIANNIFSFAVVSGVRNAIIIMQRALKVTADGIVGKNTLGALNNVEAEVFNDIYDEMELDYFTSIIEKKPHLSIYMNGWRNRSLYA